VRRLRRSKNSLTIKTHRRAGRGGDMPVKPVLLCDVDGDRRSAATENTRRAAEDERSERRRPSSEGPRRSSVTSR
jgi:hypothetical protein